MTPFFFRREGSNLFVRDIFGYKTEKEAQQAAKAFWRRGCAVRVERGWWRWHVWESHRWRWWRSYGKGD